MLIWKTKISKNLGNRIPVYVDLDLIYCIEERSTPYRDIKGDSRAYKEKKWEEHHRRQERLRRDAFRSEFLK